MCASQLSKAHSGLATVVPFTHYIMRREFIMNKSELVSAISEKADLTKAKAAEALDAFIDIVSDALASNDEIRIVGFGTFAVVTRKATEGRNPRTGAVIKIAASKQPKFRPGKALKDQVNKAKKKKAA